MDNSTTFIEAPFVVTHRHITGGDIQVLGIASPMHDKGCRQVFFWNKGKELFFVPLETFVKMWPDGRRLFYPMNDAFELLTMLQVPPFKGAPPAFKGTP